MDEIEQDISGFPPLFGLAQVSGFMVVVMMGIWMGHFRGGFAWQSEPSLEFNWHPLLMTLSLIYLYGNGIMIYRTINLQLSVLRNQRSKGIMIYRVFRNERKKKLKYTHATIMITAFLLACIGLKAVFDSHNLKEPPVPNVYTLHSWIGIVTVILFLLQWLSGLITFLFPGLASHLRSSYLPIHVFFGLLIFILACVTALLGIMEKLIFSLQGKYQERDPEGVMVNWIGLLIIVFAVVVVYLTGNPRYKRLMRPEDEMLLVENPHE